MKTRTILSIILIVCDAEIQLNIKTSSVLNKNRFNLTGNSIKQVTDEEIQLFNVTNYNLNNGIEVEMGLIPDEVFLKDPTPYGNIFQKFKWPDVKRKLGVRRSEITGFHKKEVTLNIHEHINNTTGTTQIKTDMVAMVTNSVKPKWYPEGLPADLRKYAVNIDFEYGTLHHDVSWRDEGLITADAEIGQTKGVLDVSPGQCIVTKLVAEYFTILLEVEFEAHLIGNIVCNYENLYGKYHFYAPTIGNIMRAGKLKNQILTTALFKIGYYGNPKLTVFDKDTGKGIGPKKRVTGRRHVIFNKNKS